MEGALQELDETLYWIELLADSGSIQAKQLQPLLNETDELISIFVTIVKRTKENLTRWPVPLHRS